MRTAGMMRQTINRRKSTMNKVSKSTLSCFAILAVSASLAQGQDTAAGATTYRPDEVKYMKTPVGFETAVLYGNPTQPGLFVMRIKIPAGFKIPPHWHPEVSRTAVVLSGTLLFGLGERWDESMLEARPAGTFFTELPKQPHYAWAKDGEVIVQVTGIGPSGTVVIKQPQ
jgi:quercetin dioxygenase-like cupin family protein